VRSASAHAAVARRRSCPQPHEHRGGVLPDITRWGRVPATVEKYGGKFLIRGGKFEKLEGDWHPTRVVLLEFPSLEQAKRWYNSEEYREPKALRFKTAKTNLILVEGAS
jgi:uncharacterized protein (DUF1330 family)